MSSTVKASDTSRAPSLDIDIFSDAYIADPYPFHAQLRDVAPVILLPRNDLYVVARHQDVCAALQDWKTFSSAAGVGVWDLRSADNWRSPSIILEVDPPIHTNSRSVLTRILSPVAIRNMRAEFARAADEFLDRLVARGSFDAIGDLAQAFPLRVFPDALGIRPDMRENLVDIGDFNFTAMGPKNDIFLRSQSKAAPLLGWLNETFQRENLAPGKLGAQIYEAADRGEVTESEAGLLVRSFLFAGIDTTVNGLGNALYALARNPDQYARLRADPSLAKSAFEEALRYDSPVQLFCRIATRDVEIDGLRIEKGARVALMLGVANRDPRRFENPDAYDIIRNTLAHVAFGAGIHSCLGQMVARLEGELILGALARRVQRLEISAEPTRRPNNVLRSLETLPLRVSWRS